MRALALTFGLFAFSSGFKIGRLEGWGSAKVRPNAGALERAHVEIENGRAQHVRPSEERPHSIERSLSSWLARRSFVGKIATSHTCARKGGLMSARWVQFLSAVLALLAPHYASAQQGTNPAARAVGAEWGRRVHPLSRQDPLRLRRPAVHPDHHVGWSRALGSARL